MRLAHLALALTALTLTACAADQPLAPTAHRADATATAESNGATRLSFLSRNLYVGTNLDLVVQALASPNPADDFPAVIQSVGEIQATAWESRVIGLVDEIERARPAVIGLQEVWNLNVNLTPFGVAVNIDQNFLASVQGELASRGLTYDVAATITNTAANPLPGISIVDFDVILVDPARVTVVPSSVVSQTFAANIGPVAAGVTILRGWVSVRATVDGVPLTIANTHLEAGISPQLSGLRALQTGQLMGALASAEPVVLMGDFNDDPGSPMYNIIANAGFADVWRTMRPGVEGLTCCFSPVLDDANANGAFTQRIDYVFARGLAQQNGQLLGKVDIIGATPSSRLQGPTTMIWPSDHAGLTVDLLIPRD